MRDLPFAAWAYVGAVTAAAVVLVATSFPADLDWPTLAVLTVLFLICESVPARLNVEHARVSLSFAASLASVVLLGPVGATLVGASAVVTARRNSAPIKRVFNGAQFAISGYLSGIVYTALGGADHHPGDADWVRQVILPFGGALVTFVGINVILMGGILLLSKQATARELMRESGPVSISCLGYGMFGLLIAGLWPEVGMFAPVLVLLPLFVARWAIEQSRAQHKAYEATIAALCQAVETKDYYTRGHSERVSRGSVMIAEEIGMRAERVKAIRYAGMLHDVGKLGVPTNVLKKAGPLTEEEYATIQLHPMRGLEIVRDIGFLDEAHSGIMHHHERMDGRGYPMGLAGDEIPEFARVICVADSFDAMTSTRSYRGARSIEEAVEALRQGAGTQFDPVMVEAFLRALRREGWRTQETPPPPLRPPADDGAEPDSDEVEITRQDHDDPTEPLRVVRADKGAEPDAELAGEEFAAEGAAEEHAAEAAAEEFAVEGAAEEHAVEGAAEEFAVEEPAGGAAEAVADIPESGAGIPVSEADVPKRAPGLAESAAGVAEYPDGARNGDETPAAGVTGTGVRDAGARNAAT